MPQTTFAINQFLAELLIFIPTNTSVRPVRRVNWPITTEVSTEVSSELTGRRH